MKKFIVYVQAESNYNRLGWKGSWRKSFKTREEAEEHEAFFKKSSNVTEKHFTKIVEKEVTKK